MPGKGFKLLDAYVDVHGDGSKVPSDVTKSIDADGGRARTSGLNFGKRLVAGIIGSIVVAKIGGYLGDSITAASDLSETINKSSVIFGANAQMMLNWAENAATSMGLSQGAALSAAAGFGDMFTQIGFTGDAAATMSKSVVQAAADLGSFSNLDTADVSDRIAAAFRGEYDSLQAVIPNINAARVESEALAATGKTVASELTAQEKATAVLAIVTADGARAMGDFSRTSGGFANQQKIIAAQSEDLKAKIGSGLLPGLGALAGVVSGQLMPALSLLAEAALPVVVGWMTTLADKISGMEFLTFNNGVVGLGSAFDPLITKLQPFIDLLVALWPLVGIVTSVLEPLAPILANALAPALERVSGVLVDGLTYAVGALVPYLPQLADAIILVLESVVPLIPEILELVPALLELVPPILDLVTTVLPPLVALLLEVLPPAIEGITWAFTNLLIPALMWVIENWGGVIDAAQLLADFFSGDVTATEFTDKVNGIGGAFGWVLSVVLPWAENMGLAIRMVIDFFAPLVNAVQVAFATITGVMATLFSWWMTYVFPLVQAFADLVGAVFGFIQSFITTAMVAVLSVVSSAWAGVQSVISTVVSWVVGFIQGTWGGLVGIIRGIFDNAMNSGIGEPLRGAMSFFSDLYNNIVGFFGNAGNWLADAGRSIIDGLIGGIQDALGGLTDLLNGITSMIPQVKGPPARDKVLLRPSGRMIMGGLMDGLTDGEGPVVDYLGRFTADLGRTPAAGLPVGFGALDPRKDKERDGSIIIEGDVILDAKNVKEFGDVVELIKALPQVARANARR